MKKLIDKSALQREDEILNTTENLLNVWKVTCGNICLISLIIIYTLLLVVVSLGCYYYYTRHLLLYHITISKKLYIDNII